MNIIEQTQNGVVFFQSDGIAAAGGAAHGFSTRLGGVSQGMWESCASLKTRLPTPGYCPALAGERPGGFYPDPPETPIPALGPADPAEIGRAHV